MLTLEKVTKIYQMPQGLLPIVHDINATFKPGKTHAITGASGSGKSTLLHMLAGIETPTQGRVLFNNDDIHLFSQHEKSHFLTFSIGFVFQNPHFIQDLSIKENVMLPGYVAGNDLATIQERADQLLDYVEISDKASCKPSQLSGGQLHRAALARALFNNPTFLLADEPTGNLDLSTGKKIIDLLVKCSTDRNMGIIVSTHDSNLAQAMDHSYCIKQGSIGTLSL